MSSEVKNQFIRNLPVGDPVPPAASAPMPRKGDYAGRFISLAPVNPGQDVEDLFWCSHGSPEKESIWTYLWAGPFADISSMKSWLEIAAASIDPLFLTVSERSTGYRIGMVSFMNIVQEMRRLELGHIWYAPEHQKTRANTEAVYLLLCEAFDALQYRRVEWKCDALNKRSRSAALRLGFTFEGIFRQHMIIRGRNRDTAWYSMLDSEWVRVKRNMESWLYNNPGGNLSLTRLQTGR
jgi:RimJ/RimL family protein N-acetyltransferase